MRAAGDDAYGTTHERVSAAPYDRIQMNACAYFGIMSSGILSG